MQSRILMFGWEFPPHNSGGLGVACQGLLNAMGKMGIPVTFVLPKRLPVSSPYAKIAFAEIEGSVSMCFINSPLQAYATASSYTDTKYRAGAHIYGKTLMDEVLRYAALSRTVAESEEFDLIYAHDWLSFLAGIEAKKISGKPLIVQVHATEFDRCGGSAGVNREVYAVEKAGMEAANHIIAISEMQKHIIVTKYNQARDKVTVVYNGIDDDTAPQPGYGRSRLATFKESDYSIVLFLARITLQKGPDYFLRAAKRVLEKNPKVIFIMSGTGDMERRMMEMAAELGIAHSVHFSGFLRGTETHEAYRLADLFVMPSVSEPFGIAPLEAMRTGTPVLISKQSGVAEVVKTALKTDFWDVEDMASKILSVVNHQPLRQTLSENGAIEVKNLSWKRTAEHVHAVVTRVAARA